MSHNIITECPACHTLFQVTQGQLKIAGGKVRCGACLEVFNAQVYRCDDLEDPEDDLINDPFDDPFEEHLDDLTGQLKQPFQQSGALDQRHKDPLFDEIEIPPFSPPTRPTAGFDKRYRQPDVEPEPITQPAQPTHNKRSIQQLPVQLPGQLTKHVNPQQVEPQPLHQPLSDPADEPEYEPAYEPQSITVSEPLAAVQTEPLPESAQQEPDWALWQTDTDVIAVTEPLSEIHRQEEGETQSSTANEPNLDQPVSALIHGIMYPEQTETQQQVPLIEADAEPETECATEPEPISAPHTISLAPTKNSDNSANRPFTPFRAEPVMIRTTREKSSLSIGWTLLCLLAITLLAGQYLWFNRQQLSNNAEMIPLYSLVCQHLPCDLDTPVMLDQISTRKLTILQHPDYQGTLSVNLLLENRAEIAQSFPAIQLSFSDRLGKLISQRLFQPADYLDTASGEAMKIPARQTVEIHFDILDPGRRALSYETSLKASSRQDKAL